MSHQTPFLFLLRARQLGNKERLVQTGPPATVSPALQVLLRLQKGRADRPTVDLCSSSYSWRDHHHYSWYEHKSGQSGQISRTKSKATHLQSVLTQQRPNCREGTPLGTPPDSQSQAVKNTCPVANTCQTHSLHGTHNIIHVTEQHTPNGAISCSAGDLTKERVTLESVLHAH